MIWPKATTDEQAIGWTISFDFLLAVQQGADGDDGIPSLEIVEQVLLSPAVATAIATATGQGLAKQPMPSERA